AVREVRLPSLQRLRESAAALGVSLIEMYPSEATAPGIERSFAALAEQRPDAVLIGAGALAAHNQLIVNLAERYRLPAMYGLRGPAEAGGLMAYVPDFAELGRQLADDVRRILDGSKPGDIPIYQATKFELIINLKTANALGLTLPRSLLSLADEVIEGGAATSRPAFCSPPRHDRHGRKRRRSNTGSSSSRRPGGSRACARVHSGGRPFPICIAWATSRAIICSSRCYP